VAEAAHALIDEQYALFNDEVMPALQRRASWCSTTPTHAAQRQWVATSLSAGAAAAGAGRPGPGHPFPQVANKSLNFIVRLGGRDAFGRENDIAIVKVPRVLPRVIRLPDASVRGGRASCC
jgi:polyphosphate kinase